jgi:hypothetical protein
MFASSCRVNLTPYPLRVAVGHNYYWNSLSDSVTNQVTKTHLPPPLSINMT